MRVRARFIGRVQGVGFRARVRIIAQRHLVTGWVKNLSDGSVLAEIQGPDPDVKGVFAEILVEFSGHIASHEHLNIPDVGFESGFDVLTEKDSR